MQVKLCKVFANIDKVDIKKRRKRPGESLVVDEIDKIGRSLLEIL